MDFTRKKSSHRHNMEIPSLDDLRRMRHYIISSSDEATPWINEHMDELRNTNSHNVDRRHKAEFVHWFERKIRNLHAEGKADEMIYSLSHGPEQIVSVRNRCAINEFFFWTSDVEKNLSTQDSGVVVKGDDGMEWYGVIKKIIILDFPN
ncbi:uncharacterized protein [Setaria viridis]|uniref:uncharacterized protein n=1 Tax=Setaria viridis TaxID=4556 RepID=UPI001493C879|nr:uncharacterized protein LOC117853733 [Setaria viridis]